MWNRFVSHFNLEQKQSYNFPYIESTAHLTSRASKPFLKHLICGPLCHGFIFATSSNHSFCVVLPPPRVPREIVSQAFRRQSEISQQEMFSVGTRRPSSRPATLQLLGEFLQHVKVHEEPPVVAREPSAVRDPLQANQLEVNRLQWRRLRLRVAQVKPVEAQPAKTMIRVSHAWGNGQKHALRAHRCEHGVDSIRQETT